MTDIINQNSVFPWKDDGYRYYPYGYFLKRKFGERVQKVSIDAGFTCPNVDGTVAIGGCVFCDNRSFSPSRRVRRDRIQAQIDDGISRLKKRYKVKKFMAYFQPATNTYAPVEELRPLFEQAISHPEVVALAIGTRPDCVPDDVLDLIDELATQVHVSVELGMQTIHDRSLDWMNRGHHHDSFLDAMERSRGRRFEICAHVMLGLPGESKEDMLDSARELAAQQVDSVKIHNLYCVKKTPLEQQVLEGKVKLMSRDDYIDVLIDFLELLPPNMIVERISGEAPPDYFVGPSWCLDKPGVLNTLNSEMNRRDSWQGKQYVEVANS